jgi:hypothetical protein
MPGDVLLGAEGDEVSADGCLEVAGVDVDARPPLRLGAPRGNDANAKGLQTTTNAMERVPSTRVCACFARVASRVKSSGRARSPRASCSAADCAR